MEVELIKPTRYQLYKDKIREYQKNNPDKVKEACRRYYLKRREQLKQQKEKELKDKIIKEYLEKSLGDLKN